MTTKILSGTYSTGYTLAAKYSGVDVTSTGKVSSASGAYPGGAAYTALYLPNGGALANHGMIQGGAGAGGQNAYGKYVAYQGYVVYASATDGGAGGDGVSTRSIATITNASTIAGGDGGGGGQYQFLILPGAAGADGGAGVAMQGGQLTNTGLARGGGGGGAGGGPAGNGGAGVVASAFAVIDNSGTIAGGGGGRGQLIEGAFYFARGGVGGAGVELQAGGAVDNLGTIMGGPGQTYYAYGSGKDYVGVGIRLGAGGTVTNGSASVSSALIYGGYGISLAGSGTVVNWGTIEAVSPDYGPTSVLFTSSADLLIAENGSDFVGQVIGGGGTLELAGGAGTITGLGAAATLSGAVNGLFKDFGSYSIDAGAAFTLAGANTLGSGDTLAISGTSILDPGDTLFIAGTLFDSGSFKNEGTVNQSAVITLANGTIVNDFVRGVWNLANGVNVAAGDTGTFYNAGTVSRLAASGVNHIHADFITGEKVQIAGGTLALDGAVNDVAGQIVGAGTLEINGVAAEFGHAIIPLGDGSTTYANGLTLTVAHVLVQGAGAAISVTETVPYAGSWTQTAGTVTIAAGKTLKFTGSGNSFTGTFTGGGTVDFVGGSDGFKNLTLSAAHMEVSGSAVTLAGAVRLGAGLAAGGASFTVAAAGAMLTGGPLVLNGSADTITGASATARLTNLGTIKGGGLIGEGHMALANGPGGTIVGTGAVALTIDLGANTLTNSGLIENTGAGGTTIAGAVSNVGSLEALGGQLTVAGAVSGPGGAVIGGGATIDFAAAFSQKVSFIAGGGTLELAKSQAYAGTINGFSHTGATALDLGDIAFAGATKATYSGTTAAGILTVTDGAHTAHIHLSGNFTNSTWTLSSDGHGGTKVVDPAALVTAMAGFGTSDAAQAAATGPPAPNHRPILASPGA